MWWRSIGSQRGGFYIVGDGEMCDDEAEERMRKKMLTDTETRMCRGFEVWLIDGSEAQLADAYWLVNRSVVSGVRPLRRKGRWMTNTKEAGRKV